MPTNIVFFLYRLGVKVYRVESTLNVTQIIDIPTLDIQELATKLASYAGSTTRLLISDTISYLFHTQINVGQTPISRDLVLAKIKNEIPEKFDSLIWDYKVTATNNGIADIVVFAPVSEFQSIISEITSRLKLTFETIEPESIALARHPDPIVGIFKKNDLNAPDDQSLNLEVTPPQTSAHRSIIKPLIILSVIILFVAGNFLLYTWFNKSYSKPKPVEPIPTSTPGLAPSPTLISTPTQAPLRLSIQNGTSRAGLAASVAAKFTENGFLNISTGNADNKNYLKSKLIFKSDAIKETYSSQISAIYTIDPENLSVDKGITFDAILILGNN